MEFYFLGGIFTKGDGAHIKKSSRSVIQYAADALQKNYIKGFCENSFVRSMTVINLPFIGSYPKRYTDIFYRPYLEQEGFGRAKVVNVGFCNISLIKNISRFWGAIRELLSRLVTGSGHQAVLVSYSMHLPFLLSCYFLRLLRKDIYWCLIVPDLPEYMSSRTGLSKVIFNAIGCIGYLLANKANCIVVITDAMRSCFDNRIEKVVIEGIADENHLAKSRVKQCGNYFLYSGTLDKRYGIRDLVDAYIEADIADYDLYICGDGDEKKYVEKMASLYPRIRYLGQIDRGSVLQLQRHATLLINPRSGNAEYTKFSFPSKVIEYMSSGTPILMFKLEGIPDEYYNYCFISDYGKNNLSRKIVEISKLSPEELAKKGAIALEYIKNSKTPKIQVQKILDIILMR